MKKAETKGNFSRIWAQLRNKPWRFAGSRELFQHDAKDDDALPWIADLNAKMQSYAEQHLAAALEFAHKLSHAKDFQDLARIEAEFFQNRIQSPGEQTKDLAEAYTKSAASAIKGSFGLSS